MRVRQLGATKNFHELLVAAGLPMDRHVLRHFEIELFDDVADRDDAFGGWRRQRRAGGRWRVQVSVDEDPLCW